VSPAQPSKHIKPLTTLVEEQTKPLLLQNLDAEVSRIGFCLSRFVTLRYKLITSPLTFHIIKLLIRCFNVTYNLIDSLFKYLKCLWNKIDFYSIVTIYDIN